MNRKTFILLALIVFFGIVGFIYLTGFSLILLFIPIMALIAGLFGWMLPAILGRVNSKVWIIVGLLMLFGLAFPTSLLFADREPSPVSTLISTTLFLLPALALVNAALLFHSVLGKASSDKANQRSSLFSLVLSILLVVKTLLNLYEFTVWDSTDDGLGYFWLFIPIFAALLSGFMLIAALPEGRKLTSLLFILVIPGLMITTSSLAQQVDFRQETAKRAERTARVIDSFYAREGRYPESLSQLTPQYILSLPKPMIIYGQDWCYESSDGYYRLGYVDREHWSDPRLIGRIFSVQGDIPGVSRMCEREILALQGGNPDYPYTYWKESE